jgi:hypothetical protein
MPHTPKRPYWKSAGKRHTAAPAPKAMASAPASPPNPLGRRADRGSIAAVRWPARNGHDPAPPAGRPAGWKSAPELAVGGFRPAQLVGRSAPLEKRPGRTGTWIQSGRGNQVWFPRDEQDKPQPQGQGPDPVQAAADTWRDGSNGFQPALQDQFVPQKNPSRANGPRRGHACTDLQRPVPLPVQWAPVT